MLFRQTLANCRHYAGNRSLIKKQLKENTVDNKLFFNLAFNQAKARNPYDVPLALKSAADILEGLPFGLHGPGYNNEGVTIFCSELMTAGRCSVESSEFTPINLYRWNIFEEKSYLFKGDSSKRISRFNFAHPAYWNVRR